MEQAALLMMQQVLAAELGGEKRVFALVLGTVRTRAAGDGAPDQVTADQVGSVAVAASAVGGREIRLRSQAEVVQALALLRGTQPDPAGPVVVVSTLGLRRTGHGGV